MKAMDQMKPGTRGDPNRKGFPNAAPRLGGPCRRRLETACSAGGPPRQPAGFTLLELLVVSMLAMLTTMLVSQSWRSFHHQNANIVDRSRAAQELRFALDGLCMDMGCVLSATPAEESRLVIQQNFGGGGEQPLIEYLLRNAQLVRRDVHADTSVVIADRVTVFRVENVTESAMKIVVTIECGSIARTATLFWSRT